MARTKVNASVKEDLTFDYQDKKYILDESLCPNDTAFFVTGIAGEQSRASLVLNEKAHEQLIRLGIAVEFSNE
jgi:hypothetical protein